MSKYIRPSIGGLTHNRFDVGHFVWFQEGDFDYQCEVKKIFTETDDLETKVSYYLLVLDTPLDTPFMVKDQDDLFGSREEMRIGIK